MTDFKKPPKFLLPLISDHDSFLHTYNVIIRRAVLSFTDNPHYHEHTSIWYNSTGEYNIYFNGEAIRCTAGTLLFIPPFAPHAMDTKNTDLSKTQIISISMPRDALHNRKSPVFPLSYNAVACKTSEIPLCIHFCGEEKAKMDELFTLSLSEYTKKRDMHRTRIFDNIDEIINLLQKHSQKTYTPQALSAAKRRADIIAETVLDVKSNFMKPPSIEDAARKAGMTARGFTKLFKNITNVTYHEFAVAVRAMEAVKLLKYSTKSMAEISDECGYADNSHFTKTFIKLFGSPPHTLRREMIEIAREKERLPEFLSDPHGWESSLDPEIRRAHRLTALGLEYI